MTDNLVERLQVAHDDPMWADHVEMPKRFIAEILAALRAATALGAGEPVAWRYRHSEQENWYYGPDAKGWWECQPLYAAPPAPAVTEGMVDHMVSRFLQWKLPEAFCPDGGISFKADYNENTPWPMRHEPVGTNLFDFGQASDMVRYMLEGLPAAALSAPPAPGVDAGTVEMCAKVAADYLAKAKKVLAAAERRQHSAGLLLSAGYQGDPDGDNAVAVGMRDAASDIVDAIRALLPKDESK